MADKIARVTKTQEVTQEVTQNVTQEVSQNVIQEDINQVVNNAMDVNQKLNDSVEKLLITDEEKMASKYDLGIVTYDELNLMRSMVTRKFRMAETEHANEIPILRAENEGIVEEEKRIITQIQDLQARLKEINEIFNTNVTNLSQWVMDEDLVDRELNRLLDGINGRVTTPAKTITKRAQGEVMHMGKAFQLFVDENERSDSRLDSLAWGMGYNTKEFKALFPVELGSAAHWALPGHETQAKIKNIKNAKKDITRTIRVVMTHE